MLQIFHSTTPKEGVNKTSKAKSMLELGYISIDVWSEILARLPVKTLLKLRCVCRTWQSLIDSVEFSYMHLNFYNNNTTNPNHISERKLFVIEGPEISHFYDPLYHQVCFTISPKCEFLEAVRPDFWDCNCYGKYLVIGHVNGILCLQKVCLEDRDRDGWFMTRDIILWNPSTRKSLTLPKTLSLDREYDTAEKSRWMEFGFGFDSSTRDYKLALLEYNKWAFTYESAFVPIKVKIYSVSTSTWTKVQNIANNHCWYTGFKPFLNGAIHWLARCCDEKIDENLILVSFDVSKEVISYTKLTGCVRNEVGLKRPILVVFRGCLAIWKLFENHSNIWVQNENGSWIKSFVINFRLAGRLHLKEDGEIFFSTGKNQLKSYNVENSKLKDVSKIYCDDLNYKQMTKHIQDTIVSHDEVKYIGNYVESLVSF